MHTPTVSPQSHSLRRALTALLLTVMATGMAACQGGNTPQSDNGQASTTDRASTDQGATSADQQTARQQRREKMRKELEAVLTADQAKQLEAKLQQGEKFRQALKELNLTADQKAKIQAIRKAAYAQFHQPSPESSPQ